MRAITVQEMRRLEKVGNAAGYTYAEMMQQAGRGIGGRVHQIFRRSALRKVVGLVGDGNNGGDTLIALTALMQLGWEAHALLVGKRNGMDHEVFEYQSAGGSLIDVDQLWTLSSVSLVLDGIFGTGFRLPLPLEIQATLGVVSSLWDQARIVAVDCPSGVDCESGEVSPGTLTAGLTLCLEAVKSGMLKYPALGNCGELLVIDLGLAKYGDAAAPHGIELVERDFVAAQMPKRSVFSHKGDFGKLMVIGGSMNYTGAPVLAGRGAYAVGTGLVQLAVPEVIHSCCAGSNLEMTWLILDEMDGVISENAFDTLQPHFPGCSAMVLGPGIGREDTTRRLIQRLLMRNHKDGNSSTIGFPGITDSPARQETILPPMVLDADALSLLAELKKMPEKARVRMVLTPHPGEMSRLTGLSVDEIQNDRHGIAQRYALQWRQTVVLKGANTVIADEEGKVMVLPVATSALAKAGSGDVLAGMIGGLLAQGLAPFDAAVCAAWLHARAGILAARQLGANESVLASQVAAAIPHAIAELS